MKYYTTFIIFGLFLIFQSCSNRDECEGICTNEFRAITVHVLDSEGEPVALDEIKVVDLKSGRDLTFQITDFMRESGYYPIFSDKYVNDYAQQLVDLHFTAFIEGEEVINEIYRVGADCCHVHPVSGELELVI